MRFTASADDFLKGELVDPGFHPSQIVSYTEKMSKGGIDPKTGTTKEQSQYLELQFKITSGKFKGVIVYQNFSEKAPTFIEPLMVALGQVIDKKQGMNVEVSEEKLKGKFVDIMVKRGEFGGKPKNEIDGYRKYTGPAVPSAPAQAGV